MVFENLILGFISQNKFCSCFSLWMKLQCFIMRGFLFILELSAGFLGFLDVFAGDFLGVRGIPRLELFQLDQALRPYQLKS